MTINKSQGQSFEAVGVDLRSPVFTHGQFYVATSRVTSKAGLCVLLPPNTTYTCNIVYPEILQGLTYFYGLTGSFFHVGSLGLADVLTCVLRTWPGAAGAVSAD